MNNKFRALETTFTQDQAEDRVMDFVKSLKGNALKITAKGAIDETVDLFKIVGDELPETIYFHCDGINRINSVGTKHFISFIKKCSDNGVKITLFSCSTAIVNVINLAGSLFSRNATVNSICIPFECHKCSEETIVIFSIKELQKLNFDIQDRTCSKCQGTASFSENKEEYFHFLDYLKN